MIYHVLNGDALNNQLSNSIKGERIICREMMMDGPCAGFDLKSILATRQVFFINELKVPKAKYRSQSIDELAKLFKINDGDEVNLWFEDDLFCQANLWFCVFVIYQLGINIKLSHVRPKGPMEYGFGGLDQQELETTLNDKTPISTKEIDLIVSIWRSYQNKEYDSLKQLSIKARASNPWIANAIAAHLDRFVYTGSFGLHEQLMLQSISEANQQDFKSVFKIFSSKAAIYGYGDLQAKKIYDKMIKHV